MTLLIDVEVARRNLERMKQGIPLREPNTIQEFILRNELRRYCEMRKDMPDSKREISDDEVAKLTRGWAYCPI